MYSKYSNTGATRFLVICWTLF